MRHIIHFLTTLAFYAGVFHVARFFSNRIRNTAVILCYHRVVERKPDFYSSLGTQVELGRFKKQLAELSRHFAFIRFSELVDQIKRGRIDANCIVMTFDDGFKDSYTTIYPLLKEFGLPANFFVSPVMLGSWKLLWQNEPWYLLNHLQHKKALQWQGRKWDLTSESERIEANAFIRKILFSSAPRTRDLLLEDIRKKLGVPVLDPPTERLMLSADEIAQMKTSGLVELGAHSMTHPLLSKCNKTELHNEIRHSKTKLEAAIGERILYFSYPFGDYRTDAITSVEDCGYVAAVTLDEGLVSSGDNPFLLKRISVVRDDTVHSILIRKILPFYFKQIITYGKGLLNGHRKN